MERLNVLFTAEAAEEELAPLALLCELEIAGWQKERRVLPEEELIRRLKGKQVLATSYDKVTRRVIENSPELKFIACGRGTPVNVDAQCAKEKGIIVAYTPGRNSDVTAEFAVGLLLDAARNISVGNRAILNHSAITNELSAPVEKKKDVTWGKVKGLHPYMKFKGPQIRNKNVGIVGFGSIGRRVGRILMEGFGANLFIYDPYVQPIDVTRPGIQVVDFKTLLHQSDFISCHMKITEETIGLFDYQAFRKMKANAVFVNNSRGAVVNEQDLIRALRERLIGGAALESG